MGLPVIFLTDAYTRHRDVEKGVTMKRRGKGIRVMMSRLAYDNPKVNKQMLNLKKALDEVNTTLEGFGNKKKGK